MKKLILSIALVAFAVAVNAGDDKKCTDKDKAACADKAQAGCCAKYKVAVSTTKAQCPMAKTATSDCGMAKTAGAECPMAKCGKEFVSVKKPLQSPKAASESAK